MRRQIPIVLAFHFFIYSSLYCQDFSGRWLGPAIYLGDSSALLITKDSLIYSSLDKRYPLSQPYSYKLTASKKKKNRIYLFLTMLNSPKIHVIKDYQPDSCLKIHLDDIVNNQDMLLPDPSGKISKKRFKELKSKKQLLTVSFYREEIFRSFLNLPVFSSINDSVARNAFIQKLFQFRRETTEKFGTRAFEDGRTTQWLYFDFFVANGIYPFDSVDQVINIRKEKSWQE